MRGYWLPPGYKEMTACDGFFLKSDAVFISDNPTRDWDMFIHIIVGEFLKGYPDFMAVQRWEQNVYVVLDNGTIKLITDDTDGYIAVYLIVPKEKSCNLSPYLSLLKNILLQYYPKSVYRRINYRELKRIDGERYGE